MEKFVGHGTGDRQQTGGKRGRFHMVDEVMEASRMRARRQESTTPARRGPPLRKRSMRGITRSPQRQAGRR